MNEPSSYNASKRRKRNIRIFIYSLILIWVVDHFLIHPAQITYEDLPSVPAELKPLADRLEAHVLYLASPELKGRKAGTPENEAAAKYILEQFSQMDLASPALKGVRTQEVHPSIGDNVFSAFSPIHPLHKWIVLGAHFDHLGEEDGDLFLGADDNASSVAVLLETARLLRQPPVLNQYNILLVGFNSEEPPHFLTHLMGSNQFMMRLKEVGINGGDIRFAVIMDLMGGVDWKPLQDSLFALGSEKTPTLEALLPTIQVPGLQVNRFGIHMVESIPGSGQTPFSDYDTFRDRHIPFLFLSSGRTPHYHRSTDTAEKLHYARMARSALWLEKLIRGVDALPESLIFDKDRENYVEDFKQVYPLIREASSWSGKITESSWISLFKLNRDRMRLENIREKIESHQPLDANDAKVLSLASIRMQCLLGNMGPCLLLPGF